MANTRDFGEGGSMHPFSDSCYHSFLMDGLFEVPPLDATAIRWHRFIKEDESPGQRKPYMDCQITSSDRLRFLHKPLNYSEVMSAF